MATQKVYCSYQEIIDLHTESDKVSVLGLHVPDNDTPHKMFKGLYDAFRKFRYLGMDITLVPSARLPVDPLQVSYEAGEPTIDPRDVLNPIMFHGCHGEDLGNILNSLYTVGDLSFGAGQRGLVNEVTGDSVDLANMLNVQDRYDDIDLFEKLYYKALTDNSWRKANPQRGFKKNGLRPMIYKVASTHQILPSESMDYVDGEYLTDESILGFPAWSLKGDGSLNAKIIPRKSLVAESLLTNRITSLGWMDTRTPLDRVQYSEQDVTRENLKYHWNEAIEAMYNEHGHLTRLPTIYMGVILMPPAYKTEQYFRLIINHRFEFARFRSISFQNDINTSSPAYQNWNDDLSNNLGSGDDSSSMSLSSEISAYSDIFGVGPKIYSTLTIDGVDYTAANSASSSTAGFALVDGKVYLAYGRGIGNDAIVKYYTGETSGYTFEYNQEPYTFDTSTSTFTLSPTDSDLLADLLDGGIDYDGE